eukprot:gene32564-12063_t
MEKRKARLKPMIGGYAEQDKEEATPTSTPVRSRTAKIMMIALLLILAGFGTIYALHIRVLHAPGTGILVSTPVLKKLTQAGFGTIYALRLNVLHAPGVADPGVADPAGNAGVSVFKPVFLAPQRKARYVHKVGAHNCFMAEEMEITDLYA